MPTTLMAVVHLGPCPSALSADAPFDAVLERALADAHAARDGGADALMVENFGDAPFHAMAVPPETVAAMTRCVRDVRERTPLPVGVNVLMEGGNDQTPKVDRSLEILRERYARGDIDAEEFERRRDGLTQHITE